MNTDIIARWRDAISDPPKHDAHVLYRGSGTFAAYMKDGKWTESLHGNALQCVYPGDQWLDITDVPAVAVAKVQAAVDEMTKYADEIPGTLCARGLKWARQLITKHTEVTP